jgi:hypothetical protein
MRPDHLKERGAVLRELGLADAVDLAHLGGGRGPLARHVEQRAVGKYHIGRHELLAGKLEAALLERLEQGRVGVAGCGKR